MGTITRNFANFIGSGGVLQTEALNNVDLNQIKNDIATLALREAVNANRIGTNLVNSFIDQFEDASGIDTLTNSFRNTGEFIHSVQAETFGTLANMTTANWNFGSLGATSGSGDPITISHGTSPDEDGLATTYNASTPVTVTSGTPWQLQWDNSNSTGFGCYFTVVESSKLTGNPSNTAYWQLTQAHMHGLYDYGFAFGSQGYVQRGTGSGSVTEAASGTIPNSSSATILLQGTTSNYIKVYTDGTLRYTTQFPQNFTKSFQIGGTGGNACTATDVKFSTGTAEVVNATANFTSTTINPADSTARTKLGLIVLYKDNSGTNALNTDIVAQVSADNGSNYSTCTLTPKGNFDSSGTKIAIANDVTVTSGTDLKYKISLANQSSGSKEARITGVSLLF